MSAYIRKMALDGYCLYLDLKELHRMAYLLQMCSNNLNQYTHEAHLTGYLYPQDVEALRCQLEELTDLTRREFVLPGWQNSVRFFRSWRAAGVHKG